MRQVFILPGFFSGKRQGSSYFLTLRLQFFAPALVLRHAVKGPLQPGARLADLRLFKLDQPTELLQLLCKLLPAYRCFFSLRAVCTQTGFDFTQKPGLFRHGSLTGFAF